MTPLTQQFIHCHFLQFLATVAQHAGESSYEPQELSDSITQKVYAVTSYIHRHYASELRWNIWRINSSSVRTICRTSSAG